MTTERFSKAEFEAALAASLKDYNLTAEGNFRLNEWRYHVVAKTFVEVSHSAVVEIASSVDASGFASDAGENSIRVYITGENGLPLGNKIQRWVTRIPGWEHRMYDIVQQTVEMAQAIKYCPGCKTIEKIFIVKKEGKNKGRLFVKCACEGRFTWLNAVEQTGPEDVTPKPVAVDDAPKAPKCPDCAGPMVLRNGSRGQFYGCRNFPNCRGTRNISDPTSHTKAELVALATAHLAAAVPAVPVTPTVFEPSKYQKAVLDWALDNLKHQTGKSLIVQAVAGSGKSTTGEQLIRIIPNNLRAAYMAFNVDIVKAMQGRNLPDNVEVRTTNSFGFKFVRQALGQAVQVDDNKTRRMLESVLDKYTHRHLYGQILDLIKFVRANLSGTSDAELNELADHYGVEVNGDSETIFAAVAATLDRCNKITTVVDLDEQLYFPVKFNLPTTQYDVVVADEAQDLTKCQAALLLKMVKPGGVIVAVGDTWQSIYGFRGAGIHALEDLKENLGAEELPLSITYRCCIEVVNLITSKFPDTGLEAAPWAKQGAITHMSSERALLEYSPADMILCRTNAPLVEPCFALIRKGIKATIRGREIGTGLVMMIRKMKATDMVDLLTKLNEYSKAEVTKLEAAEKTSQAQVLKDKVETIIALTDGCGSITELEDKIDSIFSDDKVGVVFSSIHKAKGLEAERVFILHPELLPHPMAKQGWEKEQERHLEYVAITRAKSELVYVEN